MCPDLYRRFVRAPHFDTLQTPTVDKDALARKRAALSRAAATGCRWFCASWTLVSPTGRLPEPEHSPQKPHNVCPDFL